MRQLRVLSMEDAQEWDNIAQSFSNYDVYYLSGYVKAFQIHGDGEPLLFYYQGENLRGINVVMKRDIGLDPHFVGKLPLGQYFDLATPYGYGGWLLEGVGDATSLFESYGNWCREHGIVSEFVRFHPVLNNALRASCFYDVTSLGPTVAMSLDTPEIIWGNLASNNRNKIRKAKKNGISIYSGRSPQLYEQFRLIYNQTMDKDQASDYYYFKPKFYQSVLSDLPYQAQIFFAEYQGEVIAGSIMLAANGRMNYHLSGSLREYQHLAPTNLLLYEAAKWGSSNGYRTLHLGGGVGCREDNLFQFKKGFHRGEMCQFSIGRVVFDQSQYYALNSMREEIEESEFFPKYRA